MNRLVILDRDGTINVERNYLSAPEQIELIPQAADAIKILRELNLPVVVITNQSGVGRGYFDLSQLEKIHARLREILRENGAEIDQIYFCPHQPDDDCECRKPLTKLADEAAREFNAALKLSFVVGDNACDIELGKNIGATTILVRTGHGRKTEENQSVAANYTVENLFEAAKLIEKIIKEDDGKEK